MRIGFDATPLLVTRAGIGKYTHALLAALGRVAPDHDYRLYANRPILDQTPLPHAYHSTVYFPRSRWLWEQTLLSGIIRQDGAELVHFTNNSAPLTIQVPYIVSIHDASLFLYRRYHPWQRILTLRLLMPLIAKRAAKIVTDSHYARRDLQKALRLPANKFEVIYLGVGEHFRPITDPITLADVRQRHNLPPRYILYVGTLEPRKNLKRLLQAFAELQRCPEHRQTKLVLVGASGWQMPDFEKQVEALDLRDCLVRLGYVSEVDLPAIYSMATCLAFPSLYEGFGIPPLESMACGTPVLTSENSAMSEVCGDAALFIDPANISSIRGGLHTLLCNSYLRDDLRERGFERTQSFSWEQTARQTAALYREVV